MLEYLKNNTFFSLEPEAASIYYNTELSNYQDVIKPTVGLFYVIWEVELLILLPMKKL